MWHSIETLNQELTACTLCPRLVVYREAVALQKKRQFANCHYWGKPVPGFGDPKARLLIVGLAPAAHGGNRTGRIFTGDPSGRWLFRALRRAGFANQAESTRPGDGLELADCYVTAVIHCAPPFNQPAPDEITNCSRYFVEEVRLLNSVRVVVALGAVAFRNYLSVHQRCFGARLKPLPSFAHGSEYIINGRLLLGCYHPSQRNTSTRLLTETMLDAVFSRAQQALKERFPPECQA